MRRAATVSLVLLLGLVLRPVGTAGQPDDDEEEEPPPPPDTFKELRLVTTWDGTVTARSTLDREDLGPGGTFEKVHVLTTHRATVHLVLTDRDEAHASYTGTARGESAHRFHESKNTSCKLYDIDDHGGGSWTAADGQVAAEEQQTVQLLLDFDNGTYDWIVTGPPQPTRKTEKCADIGPAGAGAHGVCTPYCGPTQQSAGSGANPSLAGAGKLPAGGATLTGRSSSASTGTTDATEWSFRPTTEEVELIVEPLGHDQWMPEAGDSSFVPAPGPLAVKATLQKRGGGPPPVKARAITFDLVEVSTLPGICNNFPVDEPSTRPDLAFDAEANRRQNPLIAVSGEEEATSARSTGPPHVTATAKISSYDWGAHGTLVVKAQLEDGTSVTGHLAGGGDRLLIPKRSDGSRIADRWKREHRVSEADDWDEENDPPADESLGGHRGDGLTLFEEYRGFREKTAHFRGDPARKEMFVVDRMGGRSKAGIRLFRGRTGLVIHHQLVHEGPAREAVEREAQVDRRVPTGCGGETSRDVGTQHGWVVNFNNGRAAGFPGITDKFAIGVDAHDAMYSVAIGVVGEPRSIRIGATSGARWQSIRVGHGELMTDGAASVIAHELGHAAGLSHHGECDRIVQWRRGAGGQILEYDVQVNADGTVTLIEPGHPVTLEWEGGGPLGPTDRVPGGSQWLGIQQGQHSGQEDCFMRYDTATAYVAAGRDDVRVLFSGAEMRGIELCSAPEGTGVNMAGRRPQPRYGPARAGNCKGHVCVNDREPHQP